MPEYTRLYRKDLADLIRHSGRTFDNRDPFVVEKGVLYDNNVNMVLGDASTYSNPVVTDYARMHVPQSRTDRRVILDNVEIQTERVHELNEYLPEFVRDACWMDPFRVLTRVPGVNTAENPDNLDPPPNSRPLLAGLEPTPEASIFIAEQENTVELDQVKAMIDEVWDEESMSFRNTWCLVWVLQAS